MLLRVVLVGLFTVSFAPAGFAQSGEKSPGNVPAPATRADLEAFAVRIESKIDKNDARLAALEERVAALDGKVTAQEDRVATLSDEQQASRQALNQIAKTDKYGNSYLRIDAQHEPTSKELNEAIKLAAPKVGTIILHNRTNANQWVAVNGWTVNVVARSKYPVTVPYDRFEVWTKDKFNNRYYYRSNFYYPKTERIVALD